MLLTRTTNKEDWKPETVSRHLRLSDSFLYGEVQAKEGYDVARFTMGNDASVLFATCITYNLTDHLCYVVAYIITKSETTLKEFQTQLKAYYANKKVVFIRHDINNILKLKDTPAPQCSFVGTHFQPRFEWMTPITGSQDQILSAMHPKTRYSVRLAEKRDVSITIIKGPHMLNQFESFFTLSQTTAERNKFELHTKQYYKNYFEYIAQTGEGFLVEARFNNSVLASHLIVISGDTAHYVFGSSSNTHRDVCAPYLAHFKAMLEAKEHGCTYYNFGGISEQGSNKAFETLTTFKKKFGGVLGSHNPFFDTILNTFWYYIYIIRKFIRTIL